MKPKVMGYLICALGMAYLYMETRFFGSNWWPTCPEEVIADGIGAIICCIGLAVVAITNAIVKTYDSTQQTSPPPDQETGQR